jgi:hypothetical protein
MKRLALATTVVASLALPAQALAHRHSPVAHLSVARAQQSVVHYFGLGTTAICHRATAHSAICAYSTPATNVGFRTEAPATWSGTCRVVRRHDSRYRVLLPARASDTMI